MLPKINQLIRDLESVGFVHKGGISGYSNFRHPKGVNITISSNPNQQAKYYQIKDVKRAIELVSDEQT